MARTRTTQSARALADRLKLRIARRQDLTIRRQRAGDDLSYHAQDGTRITDEATLNRLTALAVPPAYQDVCYAQDERAHLQAVGRDAAGRLQYLYHPEWEKVRETQKAQRLAFLAEALPRLRRTVAQYIRRTDAGRSFALAAAIELVAGSAIRPGSEEYARRYGTRGKRIGRKNWGQSGFNSACPGLVRAPKHSLRRQFSTH